MDVQSRSYTVGGRSGSARTHYSTYLQDETNRGLVLYLNDQFTSAPEALWNAVVKMKKQSGAKMGSTTFQSPATYVTDQSARSISCGKEAQVCIFKF